LSKFDTVVAQALQDALLLVQAEAVNAVIDVYGARPDGAAGFAKTGLLQALQSMLPAFKQKVRTTCHCSKTAYILSWR
jgi:Mg-chelatase subunit ChlI